MTRHTALPPTEAIGAFTRRAPALGSLPDLLGLIAQSIQADMIQLGIDLGTGYRRDCFIGQTLDAGSPSDRAVMREMSAQPSSSLPSLAAPPDWVDQRPLPVGTAGRRSAPRSDIALMRSPSRPAFKPSERRQLTLLLPHFNRVIALACELEYARQREACALAVLEHADYGCLLLSQEGAPLHGNPLAFELLEQARIRVGHRLQLPTRLLQGRFDAALACATAPDCRSAPTFLAPGPPPVAMTLHPPTAHGPSAQPLAAPLTLTLRGQRHAARLPGCVAQHFSLTPAEFRLCAALVDGASLKACAQNWNRSYDTLRSQLKAILAKTGTHRQAELVALLEAFRTP